MPPLRYMSIRSFAARGGLGKIESFFASGTSRLLWCFVASDDSGEKSQIEMQKRKAMTAHERTRPVHEKARNRCSGG